MVLLEYDTWIGYVFAGFLILLVFLIGITVFSYLNLVIEELPKEEDVQPLRIRLTKGRSACPYCGHTWRVRESIPVFSWLLNKHKCVYCFEHLSARHTLIELLGGFLAVASVVYYGISVQALTVFLVLCVLSVIAFIDIDTQYIPPELNLILAVIGVISNWTLPGPTILERLIGAASVSVPLILIVLIVPNGFGWGDIKMMAAAGVLLGWKANIVAFFIGMIIGGIYGGYLLIAKKKGKKEHFAFGPFLSIGIAVSMYADIGTYLMNQYIGIITASMSHMP
jgi:leader peptidase (prepilin peptidase)/N-methyltransferase